MTDVLLDSTTGAALQDQKNSGPPTVQPSTTQKNRSTRSSTLKSRKMYAEQSQSIGKQRQQSAVQQSTTKISAVLSQSSTKRTSSSQKSQNSDSIGQQSQHQRKKRGPYVKACKECKQTHSACDQGRPCSRCKVNNLECVDVPRKKSSKKRKQPRPEQKQKDEHSPSSASSSSDSQQSSPSSSSSASSSSPTPSTPQATTTMEAAEILAHLHSHRRRSDTRRSSPG